MNNMRSIIKAERIKFRHTFSGALPVAAPVITLLLAFVLTGGMRDAFPAGAWNWWYSLLLPGMLSVSCYLNIAKERKCKYYNLKVLPIDEKKLLLGKIANISFGLLLSNLVIFAGASIGGEILGTTISVSGGAAGVVLLSVCYLWEIPLYLFLSVRSGMFASVFCCIILSASGVAVVADGSFWWTLPSSVPVRLMCPVLGLLPNGLPVPGGSTLQDPGVIVPGVIISLFWFAGMTLLFVSWFVRREAE